MGVSFKVARTGTRYKPKLVQIDDKDNENDSLTVSHQRNNEGNFAGIGDNVADDANVFAKSRLHSVSEDIEVSISLNLFPNGFSVGKATELFNDVPKQLHPYDRASETLFTAIEYGWLPGDIFDDIPGKYVNGALLCEIRDYRNCSAPRAGTTSVEHSPVVHRVLLQMCMENVVKDILSISDNSWTYEDLLEVESRILKALQPDLHLNPVPLLDRFCGEHLTKKLNLGIAGGWKRRKVSDASRTNTGFSNPQHVTHIRGIDGTQNSNSQSCLVYQDRGDSVLKTISQSKPLATEPSYQLAARCNQSVSTDLTPSNIAAIPKQCFSIGNSVLREPSSLVLAETSKCETEAIQGPILKKPKQEPVEFYQQLLPGSQLENNLEPELPRKNNLLHQRIEAEKIARERFIDKGRPSPLINYGQQAILEGIPKFQAGMPISTVKQEPAETSDFPNSNMEMMMELRRNQSNVQHQRQHLSPLIRANIPPDPHWNQMVQPVDKNSRSEIVTQKRKALHNPQVAAGVRIASARTHPGECLPREASVPAKRKKNSHPKGSSTKTVDSLAGTSNVIVANSSSLPLGNLPLPMTSKVKGDPLLKRFLMIEAVTERYGLNNKKCKVDRILPRKQVFRTTPLVDGQILNSAENENLKDATTDRISLSQCFVDRRLIVFKTRTLTFVHPSHVLKGNDIPMVDSEGQIKLVMFEKLNDGIVEASVLYGNKEELDSIDFPLLPNFPGTHSADLFAAQFASLMVREGNRLVSDQIEPIPLNADGSSSSQQLTVIGSGTLATGTPELPSSNLFPVLSPSMLTPMTGGMSALNPRQLSSQNILSGGHLLPPGSIQPTLHLSASNLSKSHFDITAEVSPVQPQWQQILNKRAHLQFQMIQRQRQKEQLMQGKRMAGRLGAARGGLGTMQLGGGIQGHGNFTLGSFANIVGLGSMNVPRGGQLPWIGNVGQFNNLGSNTPSLNESNHLLGMRSDHPTALLAKLRTAEGQGRALPGGRPFQRNAGVVPMRRPTVPDMAYLLNNQQQLQAQMHQQLQRLAPQQEMRRSLLQPPEVARLSELVGSPLAQVTPQQFDQQPQMSPQQLSSGSALRLMNNGNTMVGPESPELSSRTPGSVGSSNASSSRNFSGFSKDGKTGGV